MYGPVATMPLKRRRILMEVNALAPLDLAQAVVPGMTERGSGWIVNLTSATARLGGANSTMALYGASKAALNGLIRSLALELVTDGITVNGVEPGTVLTPGVQVLLSEEEIEGVAANIPMRRFAAPIDIAHAHLFFASDEASYVTGQTLVVDGGWVLP
jgi:3-oxoacyl-[acyl-carrier protein] reductase